jgi:hypothetical protein
MPAKLISNRSPALASNGAANSRGGPNCALFIINERRVVPADFVCKFKATIDIFVYYLEIINLFGVGV